MKREDPEDVAARVLDSEAYRDSILRRAAAGTLPPAVEERLWDLAARSRSAQFVKPRPRLSLVRREGQRR